MIIDYENSKKYYERFIPCNCEICRLYYSKISECYPEIKEYIQSLGADILKPFELIPVEFEGERRIEYISCQYIIFGQCEDGFEKQINGVRFFRNDDNHPLDNDIKERHFILDFGPVTISWE